MKLENQEINLFLERVREGDKIGMSFHVDETGRLNIQAGDIYLSSVSTLQELDVWLNGWKLGRGSVGEAIIGYANVEDIHPGSWGDATGFEVTRDKPANYATVRVKVFKDTSW